MLKQIQTILSALPGQILGLVTKVVTAIETHVNMIAINPIRLTIILFTIAIAVDIAFQGHFKVVESTLNVLKEITALLNWQVVATIWAVAIFTKK